MNDVLIFAAGFAAAIVATELVVRDKLQTGLARVLIVHVLASAAAALTARGLPLAAGFVFWSGMFALWFGVRSHIESSILLRLLTSLAVRPATRDELLQRYAALHGRSDRVDELIRGGLVRAGADGVTPTAKGRFVARVTRLLG